MANLFWKTGNRTRALLEKPFSSEEDFENTVFTTKELLEDVFLLRRQIRGGSKAGIPDILGVDSNGNICIIEMKNVSVDAGIIPQVLEYAIWAEANPDSIKSLWLERSEKPEDVSIDWEDFQVRILIMAPSIHRSTVQFVEKINYAVDLLEVKRWVEKKNFFLTVNKLEQSDRKGRVKPAKGLPDYDVEFFRSHYNRKSADVFFRYVAEVESLVKRKGWNLEKKFNRNSCAFKAGFFNAFSIKWIGTRTFAFNFNVSQQELRRFSKKPTRFNAKRNRALFYIEPPKTRTMQFEPMFSASYKRIATGSE